MGLLYYKIILFLDQAKRVRILIGVTLRQYFTLIQSRGSLQMNLVYKWEPRNYYLIPGLDPISAAFSSPVYVPPRERIRGKSVGLTTMADPDLE